MADREFSFTAIRMYSNAMAARLAVLYPLLGRKFPREKLPVAGELLLSAWRARLDVLRNDGMWPILDDDARFFRTRNCWPTMFNISVGDGKKNFMCKLPICPWCHARRTMKLYDRVRSHVVADDRLILMTAIGRRRLPPVNNDDSPNSPRMLQDAALDMIRRLLLANQRETYGAFWSVAVEPMYDQYHVNDRIGWWQVSMQVLVLVKPDEKFALIPATWKKIIYRKPNDRSVVQAVRAVCRYPVGLFRGDPKQTVEVLTARRNIHLSGYTGRLHFGQRMGGPGTEDMLHDDAGTARST